MSGQGTPITRSHGVLLSRLLWPTAIIFAGTLWVVFSTILWTSENVNEIETKRQHAQLVSALEQHLAGLRARLLDFAAMPEVLDGVEVASSRRTGRSRFDEQALALREFDSIAIVTSDWKPLAGVYEGAVLTAGSLKRLRDLAGSTVEAAGAFRDVSDDGSIWTKMAAGVASRLLYDGSEIYAVFAIPVTLSDPIGRTDPRMTVLVAHKYLDERALQKIAVFHDLDGFRIVAGPPSNAETALPIRNNRGEIAAHLSWNPSRPGDLMRERLVPMTVAGFLIAVLLFGLVAVYLQWLASDLAESEASSRRLIGRDPLSGLANRLLFSERLDHGLEQLPRTGRGLAVLFIDLDRFKDVNDTHGHQAGDDLIRLVAQRLTNLLRSSDTLARFGGDEFAIIQSGLRSADDAHMLAKRILDALTQPFRLARTEVMVGASIGIALAPEHGQSREVLMGLADTALYQAKSEGRNRFIVFQQRMDETIRMRKLVEDDLRRAIDEDGLVLHYQPLYSSDGETILAVEALVRWPHPTRGLISPTEFIPIAEERGLVIPLGQWVLRRACEDGKRWPGIRIAVNVSPIQFRHRDFVAEVLSLLEETGFDPGRLELELTEGVVVEDADAAESAMMELRALGIHLALDDFGTGYSSLIYLRRFAFDTIKIDRSFLESMEATGESAILVHSMVHLGRALGLTVTAEGVETKEQHRFLQALGCHQLQGFLFSKPLPAEQIDALLSPRAPHADAA